MGNLHMVSNRERTSELSSDSLFLVSEPQNKYNTVWKSKAITARDVTDRIEDSFRKDNFSDELDLLQEIDDTYLNAGNLSIGYNKRSGVIYLKTGDNQFSEFDAQDFIAEGMLQDVRLNGQTLILTFIADGKYKDISVDLSAFTDTYYAADGLCCDSHIFSIDTNRVSTVDHRHTVSDITDFVEPSASDGLCCSNHAFSIDTGRVSVSGHRHTVSDITDYTDISVADGLCCVNRLVNIDTGRVSTVGHKHVRSDITDFPAKVSVFDNDSGYLVSGDFGLAFNASTNTINLSAGSGRLSAKIPTSGGTGVDYDYVHSELSNDGYGLRTVFRDWN